MEGEHECLCYGEYVCLHCRGECRCGNQQHVDYPHIPGMLYDCWACRNECLCTEEFSCLYCASFEYERNA